MHEFKDDFLETASLIGARLCRDALWAGRRCNWLGASMEFVSNTWTVAHRAFGPEIYNGTSGIAIFLTRLYGLTKERPYRTAAEGAAEQASSRLQDIGPSARIGFYSGVTGIAYVLAELGETLAKPELTNQGLHILEGLVRDDPSTQGLDVLAGSAGAIPALLILYQRYRRNFLLDLAVRHGEHLLDTAQRSDIGWSWNTLNVSMKQDLTGFSHGTAGIAWALLELHAATKEDRFRAAAEQGFRYERHWFSKEHENWPDFRNLDEPTAGGNGTPSYMIAWCHGAPGIGLSRLRAYELSAEEVYRQEAEAALRTTVTMLNQFIDTGQGNYSLCHGSAGNADLMIYASRVFEDSGYASLAYRIGRKGIDQYQKTNQPWPCGVLGGGETPNLMLGLAGIGYFYLRLYDPVKIPPLVILLPQAGLAARGKHNLVLSLKSSAD